jgi:ABC-type Na+ efflux pump permease subunit
MTFLPIVTRELRVASRRRGAFWARLVAAGVAIFFGGSTLWLGEDWWSAASVGSEIFNMLASLAFCFCLVAGPIFTADVVSEEKREGTLGLLFLTDLRGYDVVLGKLAAASVTALFGLLAALPVLALALMFGGVSLAEFGRVVLTLGNTLWFSLVAGILVSALCRHARSAFTAATFVIFLFAGVLPWLESLWREQQGTSLANACLLALNPGHTLTLARASSFSGSRLEFWASLGATHALTWFFLGLTSWIVPRVWHEQGPDHQAVRWRQRWQGWSFGAPIQRRELRLSLLQDNPIVWLGGRNRLKMLIPHWSIGLAALAWLLASLLGGLDWRNWGITLFIAAFLQTPLKWLIASEATHRWGEDRQSGALELLLTTPLPVRELLAGEMRALRRLFQFPVATLIVVEIIALLLGAMHPAAGEETAWVPLAALVVFVWDLHTLAWVGMWQGLVKRKTNRAFLATLYRVILVPWLVFAGCVVLIGNASPGFLAAFGGVVCGVSNLYFFLTSRGRLLRQFRLLTAGEDRHSAPEDGAPAGAPSPVASV